MNRKRVADGRKGERAFNGTTDDLDKIAAAEVWGGDRVNDFIGGLSYWVGRNGRGEGHDGQEGSEEGAWNMHSVED